MYLGLRMTEGISEIDFEQNFGQKLENIYGSVLQKYKETGFLERLVRTGDLQENEFM